MRTAILAAVAALSVAACATTTENETTGTATSAFETIDDIQVAPVFDYWKKEGSEWTWPCDFPGRGSIETYQCSTAQTIRIHEAMDLAAYNVWRVLQVLDKVKAAPANERPILWDTYFESYDQKEGPSLRNWFGPYSSTRFEKIDYAYRHVWDQYLSPGGGMKDKRISCDCRAGAMSAHAANPKGIEVCPSFWTDHQYYERAQLLIHEFMHDVKDEPGPNIQDTHWECEIDKGDDGLQKCYSEGEAKKLAQYYPNTATENNENYALYATYLMYKYQAQECTSLKLCSPRNLADKDCQPPPPRPQPAYPLCTGGPGELGCACADVPSGSSEDAAKEGGYPDGAGSFLENKTPGGQFCNEPDVVCGKEMFDGREIPVCKSCKETKEIGCPCTREEDCGGELTCFGSSEQGGFDPIGHGTCMPKEKAAIEKLPWFCLDNCAAISPDGENQAACVFHQVPGMEFSHGTCVNAASSCGMNLPGQCEHAGKICRYDSGTDKNVCVAECKTAADCAANGFPDSYECDAEGGNGYADGHCVPYGCANDTSKYCSLFR